jgi:tetratricopeptide (TPR) repeat protein
MTEAEAEILFTKGVQSLARGEWPAALACFENAARLKSTPLHNSFLALCIARERGQYKKAVSLCTEALEAEPDNSLLYLNLGKVHLLQKERDEAIRIFRLGLGRETNAQIIAELDKLGSRKPPPLSFLKRDNPLNRYLGKILTKLGLR